VSMTSVWSLDGLRWIEFGTRWVGDSGSRTVASDASHILSVVRDICVTVRFFDSPALPRNDADVEISL
jgi:hypothetical protein